MECIYQWHELVTIDRHFQASVNLVLDRDNKEKFLSYIPTESSVYILHQYLRNILKGTTQNSTILIGPYGKGKSHLLLIILGILEKNFLKETEYIIPKIEMIDRKCGEYIRDIIKGKPYLTVLVTDTGNTLSNSFLIALNDSLCRKGLDKLIPNSYYKEAIKIIQRWEKSFPDIYQQFLKLLLENIEKGKEEGKENKKKEDNKKESNKEEEKNKKEKDNNREEIDKKEKDNNREEKDKKEKDNNEEEIDKKEKDNKNNRKEEGDKKERNDKKEEEQNKKIAIEFIQKLENYQESALKQFSAIYSVITGGSSFQPLLQTDCLKLYQEVNHKLCSEYGYAGIYIVFDEFSKYIEGHKQEGFAYDMKVLQDICELANNSVNNEQEKIFFTCIAHKSLKEYGKKLTKEVKNIFQGVEGRLKEYLFVISARNNFGIFQNVLKKTEKFKQLYIEGKLEKQMQDIAKRSFQLPIFYTQFTWQEYEDIIVKGCFPMTPLATVILLLISEKAAQNERTIFTFLAEEGWNSILYKIKRKQRNNEFYIGAETIYDYFSCVFREIIEQPQIHNEWLKAEYALNHTEKEKQKKIIKAAALLHMVGNREELPVTLENISLAVGISLEDTRKEVEELLKKQLFIWRSKLGVYAFKNNIGINIEEELKKEIEKQPSKINNCQYLSSLSELEYVLPKSYNQVFSITRYFQYQFMTPETFLAMQQSKYLFQEKFADGKIIALVVEKESEIETEKETKIQIEKIKLHLQKLQEDRLIVLFPTEVFSQEYNIRKIAAIRELKENKDFLEENKVLERELELYEEDILFEINAVLEQYYLPENKKCRIFYHGKEIYLLKEQSFNHFLSEICGEYYSFSPKINHELLNICKVTGQYLKARNNVVEKILREESFEKYKKGTSPEALIFRTALVRTGVIGKQYPLDIGTGRILEELKEFFQNSGEKKHCFAELYEKLQGKDYGIRRGIMPIFLAMEFIIIADTPILYLQKKEVELSVSILNNINETPNEYYLYLEKENKQKEEYLSCLEEYLEITHIPYKKSIRLAYIAEALQKEYRALPKLISNWKELDREEWEEVLARYPADKRESVEVLFAASEKLKNKLRQAELNPRELLFEKIPSYFGRKEGDFFCAEQVIIIFTIWKQKKSYLLRQLSKYFLQTWGAKGEESLSGVLKEWYENLSTAAEKAVFSAKTTALLQYIISISGYDNEKIAEGLAKIISGTYLEDWTQETQREMKEILPALKEEAEQIIGQNEDRKEQKKVIFTGKKGEVIEKYFSAEQNEVTGFLKNAIQEAMEEFGESIDTGQKIAVLLDTLEGLLQ